MDFGNAAAYAERGMLPNAGTWMDQPAWFIEFWQLLQSTINKIELERIKRR